MYVKELIAKLKRINKNIVFVPGPGKASGVYKHQPKHPDSHENGLRWIAACQSPHVFFGKINDFDVTIGQEYYRGWRKIINLLVQHDEITKSDATKYFGIWWQFPTRPDRDVVNKQVSLA